jgi:hypothetical protein
VEAGPDSDGRAFTDGIDHTCNNWASDGMTLPQANVSASLQCFMAARLDGNGSQAGFLGGWRGHG